MMNLVNSRILGVKSKHLRVAEKLHHQLVNGGKERSTVVATERLDEDKEDNGGGNIEEDDDDEDDNGEVNNAHLLPPPIRQRHGLSSTRSASYLEREHVDAQRQPQQDFSNRRRLSTSSSLIEDKQAPANERDESNAGCSDNDQDANKFGQNKYRDHNELMSRRAPKDGALFNYQDRAVRYHSHGGSRDRTDPSDNLVSGFLCLVYFSSSC